MQHRPAHHRAGDRALPDAPSARSSTARSARSSPGVFGIFGHGNVTCLGEALYDARGVLPTYRGQNEQGMALAAIGFAKAMRRRQFMAATSSVGPGAMNMVTAAAVAHANRLPLLLLAGDTFNSRIPDPVLQQVEHFDQPSVTVNDAFRPVTRYWDRITQPGAGRAVAAARDRHAARPGRLRPGLHRAAAGRAGRGLRLPRAALRAGRARAAPAAPRHARAGGGRRRPARRQGAADHRRRRRALLRSPRRGCAASPSSTACPSSRRWRASRRCVADHPLYAGPIGVTGCPQANALAARGRRRARRRHAAAGLHDRLVDGLRQRRPAHHRPQRRALRRRQAPQPAARRRRARGPRGARRRRSAAGRSTDAWRDEARTQAAALPRARARGRRRRARAPTEPSYAQVVAAVNAEAGPDDYAVSAAGGFPGELNVDWLSRGVATFDCEYGFSCMGYELAGAWGARMARTRGEVFAFVGDGSYLMLNSELLSSVITGHKLIALLCDNGGFAVIERLQVGQGGASFNNMFSGIGPNQVEVDWVAHARALGCEAERVGVDRRPPRGDRPRPRGRPHLRDRAAHGARRLDGGRRVLAGRRARGRRSARRSTRPARARTRAAAASASAGRAACGAFATTSYERNNWGLARNVRVRPQYCVRADRHVEAARRTSRAAARPARRRARATAGRSARCRAASAAAARRRGAARSRPRPRRRSRPSRACGRR